MEATSFTFVVVLAALASGVIAGCGGSMTMLKAQATADLHCGDDYSREGVGPFNFLEKVSCNGKTLEYGYDRKSQTWRSPFERASVDSSCSKDALMAQYLGDNEVGVSGCGKQAVYVAWCMNDFCEFSRWAPK